MSWKFWQKTPEAAKSAALVREEFRAWDRKCPDCGGTTFYEGPSGGMCTNIKCANDACQTKLNVFSLGDGFQAQRI